MAVMRRLATLLVVAMLGACATTTETNSTWQTRTGEPRPVFQHLFVLALSNNAVTSATVEKALQSSLHKRDIQATLGTENLEGENWQAEGFRDKVRAAVKASGADGVVVVSLLKTEERDEYIAPTVDYMPMPDAPLYMGYAPYVGYSYSAVYQPGYYQNATDYYLQTQLYSVATEKPVWQAQSRSLNPYSLKAGAAGYASSVVKQMDKDGALKR